MKIKKDRKRERKGRIGECKKSNKRKT